MLLALNQTNKPSNQSKHNLNPSQPQKLLDILQLIRCENVGPITFFHLLKRYHTAAEALRALPTLAKQGGRNRPIRLYPRNQAEEEIEQTERLGARMISIFDEDYPTLLKHIPDPPPILTVLGDVGLWQQKDSIAIVGARNASANGCNFARNLSSELSENGMIITSGLARGIDTHAHMGAMDHGTIGVIACGIDIIYPPENAKLFKTMQENGAIISEQPIGTAPFKGSFHGRNRIISGLSRAVVVVEAAKHSGSLITAHLAADQNRDVFAVPGSPMDPRCHGTNRLLKEGASLVESANDILSTIRRTELAGIKEPTIDYYEPAPYQEPDEATLGDARQILESKLSATPTSIEVLAEQTSIAPPLLATILLEKEIAGMIQRHPGGLISAVYS